LELERRDIERHDFPQGRRGYAIEDVDRHLRAVADAVEQLKASTRQTSTIAGAAAERVQAIVAAAEASAREIEERADAQAAERLRRAEDAADALTKRAEQLELDVDELFGQLRQAAQQAIETLRGGASTLRSELESMRNDLGGVRDVRAPAQEPVPEPIAALPVEEIRDEPVEEAGPVDAEPEVVVEAAEPAREPAAVAAEAVADARKTGATAARAPEGARLVALNMALSGAPREETARYLQENFDLQAADELLDEVYARAGS
jgi:DivIVA domain-containing protein